MHTSTFKTIFRLFLASVALVGCATQTPILDQHYGEAVNAAKLQQTINTDASLNQDPIAGIDGQAANAAVDRYHKSFVQPPVTTNVFNIGVGSSTSGGVAR
jgi:predicted component of type VI protein secretion system